MVEIQAISTKVSAFLLDHVVTRLLITGGAGLLMSLFGRVDVAHYALGILIIVDTITGVWLAGKLGKLRSRLMFRGAFQKVMLYLVFLLSVFQITRMVGYLNFMNDWGILFLGATELVSILENLKHLGLPIPKWADQVLERILHKELDS